MTKPERMEAILEDIAILTGGKLITEDLGSSSSVKLADLGRAKRITIDKDNTTIVEGYGKYSSLPLCQRGIQGDFRPVSTAGRSHTGRVPGDGARP